MKVLWAGTFDPRFERNLRIRDYLAAAGIDYRVVRADLWPSDRVEAFMRARASVAFRMAITYPILLVRLLLAPTPDVYLVSYPGWFDIPVVRLVSWLKRRPMVFDIFISLYDTAITDRGLAHRDSVVGRASRLVDRLAMRLSDRVIVDCAAHGRFLADLAHIPLSKFGIVHIGADEATYRPIPDAETMQDDLVLFYGTFVPLQGVEWIVRAAATLTGRNVRFRIVGQGQDSERVSKLAEELGCSNVDFVEPVPKTELAREIARASLCLGIFGTSAKTHRVIPHKVFEALACGRPVLTGATEAIHEVLTPDEIAVCPVGDHTSLATEILRLMDNPDERKELARRGRSRFENDFSIRPQSARLRDELAKATGSADRGHQRNPSV